MPIKRSAYKELRKGKKRHVRNITAISELKTLIKKFEKLAVDKKLEEARKMLNSIISKLDKAASKGILKGNAAARKISRLTKKLSRVTKA